MAFDPADYRHKIILTDGDSAAEFFARGWSETTPIEYANTKRSDMVSDVAAAFLDAGARLLVTNTARANTLSFPGLSEAGDPSTDEVIAMNRQGAAICRTVVREHPARNVLVVGAMGPGERLLTLNEIDEAALSAAYGTQAAALADGGVDAILCRAFTEIQAAVIAVRAAIEATGLPVIGTMVFDSGPEQTETTLGVAVPQACIELAEAGVAAMGCDCGRNPDGIPMVVGLMREACDLPIWVKIDAGPAELAEGRVVYPETPQAFAERISALIDAGAGLVGGCCGVTVEHLTAASEMLKARGTRKRRR